MPSARCGECPWEVTGLATTEAALAAWQTHHDRTHGDAETLHQLPCVTFHEQALLAIKSLAMSGRDFTIGECHALVGIAPLDPARDWPRATNEAKRLGWIERVTYTQSIVEGTNGSAVAVWRGSYAATRRAS